MSGVIKRPLLCLDRVIIYKSKAASFMFGGHKRGRFTFAIFTHPKFGGCWNEIANVSQCPDPNSAGAYIRYYKR